MAKKIGTQRQKGTSLFDFPKEYLLLDVETTGLDPRYDQIIEIGAAKVVDNEVVEQFSQLTYPKNGSLMIPGFVTNKTGITEKMVQQEGRSIDSVLWDLQKISEKQIITGYNVNFDINFVYDNLLKYHNLYYSNDFVDILRLSRRFFKGEKHHRLTDVLSYCNINVTQEHRSLSDCLLTKDIFDYIRTNASDDFLRAKFFRAPKISANDIKITVDTIDETNPIFSKNVCFTGKLDFLTRAEAMQTVKNFGATPQNGVNKSTNLLVVGDTNYSASVTDGLTGKLKKAQTLKINGQDIEIISETVFLDMLDM